METYDKRTLDSTGAFYVGELERLDQTLHQPLVAVTWGRDIDLREDVSMADETSAFLTEKVPPNPQQRSAFGISASSRPRTLASSR